MISSGEIYRRWMRKVKEQGALKDGIEDAELLVSVSKRRRLD
jgi:hypothetical protein